MSRWWNKHWRYLYLVLFLSQIPPAIFNSRHNGAWLSVMAMAFIASCYAYVARLQTKRLEKVAYYQALLTKCRFDNDRIGEKFALEGIKIWGGDRA